MNMYTIDEKSWDNMKASYDKFEGEDKAQIDAAAALFAEIVKKKIEGDSNE